MSIYFAIFAGISYCGLAINHINLEYESLTFVLGCFPYELENKRALTIRSFVDDALDSFGIKLDDEKFIMSDNEPTMKRAFSERCKRVGCSDHYLNKQLEHVFTSETVDGEKVNCEIIQELFSDIKLIVTSVRRCHKQQNLSNKLILYSETRFSGAYQMLKVFLSVFDELVPVLDNTLLVRYSRIDKELLNDLCEFLSTFDSVIDSLSDNERPTLHRVLPFKQLLIKNCEINDDDKEGLKHLKIFLCKTFCYINGKKIENIISLF